MHGYLLAKLWQSRKILLCSLAVRRAKRIGNPRVGSIRPAGVFDVLCFLWDFEFHAAKSDDGASK